MGKTHFYFLGAWGPLEGRGLRKRNGYGTSLNDSDSDDVAIMAHTIPYMGSAMLRLYRENDNAIGMQTS
eukprot:2172532-Amphidinium_carterae.1